MARAGRRRSLGSRGNLRGLAARAVLVALLALLARPARGEPGARLRLEALLPADTLAFAALEGGWDEVRARAAEAGLAAWLEDPEVVAAGPAFLGGLHRALAALVSPWDAPPGRLSERAAAVLDAVGAFEGQAAIGLLADPGGDVHLVGLVDFGTRLQAFRRFLERVRDATEGDSARTMRVAADGEGRWALEVPGGSERLEVAIRGTAVLFAMDVDGLLAAVDGPRPGTGGGSASLSDVPEFRAAAGGPSAARPMFLAWLDLGHPFWATRSDYLAAAARGLRGAGVRNLAATSTTGRGGTTDRVVASLDPANPVLARALAVPAGSRTPSVGPVGGPMLRLDLRVPLEDVVARTTAVCEAAGVGEGWYGALIQAHESLGTPVEDLLAHASGGATFWAGPSPGGGLLPEVGFAVGVRDPAKAEAALASATDALAARLASRGLGADVRRFTWEGTEVRLLTVPGAGGAVAWCVKGDRFLLAPSPHALRGLLARGGGDAAPRTADDAAIRLEADLATLLAAAWDTGVPLLQTFLHAAPGAPSDAFDPALLPSSRAMAPLWSGARGRVTATAERIVVDVTHRWPVLPLVAGGLGLAWAARAAESRAPAADVTRAVQDDSVDPAEATQRAMGLLASAAREYAALDGRLPERAEDLVDRERLVPSVPPDGWGRALRWTRDASTGSVEIRSCGPDGAFWTGDDLVVTVPAP